MNVYAFIFARGGSKGLPGKNIKKLAGIPLLAHSILIARKLNDVQDVFVSTDCKEIAAVAVEYGAKVIHRPDALATDTASEWMAWQQAIKHLHATGHQFDVFLSLPTTSPLRAVEDIKQCLKAFDDQTDIVVTVTPSARSPYFNMVTRDEQGYSKIVLGLGEAKRRQDAPIVFDMTTVAYAARPTFILENSGLFAGRVKSVIVPRERAIDIDDALDFKIAEALYKS
jgi:N-acylneuraminate cytidylyltransferase